VNLNVKRNVAVLGLKLIFAVLLYFLLFLMEYRGVHLLGKEFFIKISYFLETKLVILNVNEFYLMRRI
jgi:hypothetical protein